MSNKLSSDNMIAYVLTRDADMYVKKVKYLTSLTADEIKTLIIKNNNNTFDYWAALAIHVDNVWDKLDAVTQRKYKEVFSIVAHHALKHQNVVNSIFKSIIEHKDVNKKINLISLLMMRLKLNLKDVEIVLIKTINTCFWICC